MTDYNTLVAAKSTAGSIKNFSNNSSLPVSVIVAETEAWIYRRLRTPEMLTSTTGTITTSATNVAVPARLVQPRHLLITGTDVGKITAKSFEVVRDAWTYDGSGVRGAGKPTIYYCDFTSLWFDQMANKAYPINLLYYQQLAPLAATNSTNVLTDKYPTLLRYELQAMAASWMKDDAEKDYWEKKCLLEIEQANIEAGAFDEVIEEAMEIT